MKLVFSKDKENNVIVQQENNNEKIDFSYINMIKSLINYGEMDESEIAGDFTEQEKESINRMVQMINEAIVPEEENDNKDDDFDDEIPF